MMIRAFTVAAALAVAAGANADVVSVNYTGKGKGSNVKAIWGENSLNVFAGQLKHTLADAMNDDVVWNGNHITFCADLDQHVSSGVKPFSIVPVSDLSLSNPMGVTRAYVIRDLYTFANGSQLLSTATNDFATAFQLAIWDIIHDFSPEAENFGLSLTSGSFKAAKTDGSALSSGVVNHFNSLIASIGTFQETEWQIMGIGSPAQQDQIMARLIPTPGVVALTGLGLICFRRRTR